MLRAALTRRGWRAGLAIGFVLAGAAGLIVSAWVLSPDLIDPDPTRKTLGWWTTALLIALVGCVVGPVVAFSDSGRARVRIVMAALSGGFALAAGLSGLFALLDQAHRGYPGRTTVLAVIGGAAVVVGLAVGAGARPSRPVARRDLVTAALGVGLVAAAAVPLAQTASGWTESSHTARRVPPAATPSTLTRVAWTKPFQHSGDVVPAGAGVAVLSGDRALGLDGRTGGVRWQYRRAGAGIAGLAASPDGASLAVGINADGVWVSTVLLDAITGRIRARVPGVPTAGWQSTSPELTNDAVIVHDHDFRAYSLRDGHLLWRYRLPANCVLDATRRNDVTTPSGLLLPEYCHVPNTEETALRYLLLDSTTGRVRWQREVVSATDNYHQRFSLLQRLAPDGQLAAIEITPEGRGAGRDLATGAVWPIRTAVSTMLPHGRAVLIGNEIADLRSGRVLAAKFANNCLSESILPLGSTGYCLQVAESSFRAPGTPTLSVGSLTGPLHDVALPLDDTDPQQTFEVIGSVAPGAVVARIAISTHHGTARYLVGLA